MNEETAMSKQLRELLENTTIDVEALETLEDTVAPHCCGCGCEC